MKSPIDENAFQALVDAADGRHCDPAFAYADGYEDGVIAVLAIVGLVQMAEAIRMRAYPGGVSDVRSYTIGFNQGYSEGREDGLDDGYAQCWEQTAAGEDI